jgi:hypothetical protein
LADQSFPEHLMTNPRRTFSAAANAAALKCSGMMMMPPLAGDPVTNNCNAPFAMIMLSLMRACLEIQDYEGGCTGSFGRFKCRQKEQNFLQSVICGCAGDNQ